MFRVIAPGITDDDEKYSFTAKRSATEAAKRYAKEKDTWAAAQEPSTGSDSGWAIYASFEAGGLTSSEVPPHDFVPNPGPAVPDLPVLCQRCGFSERAEKHTPAVKTPTVVPPAPRTVQARFEALLDEGLRIADVLDAFAKRQSDEQRAVIERARDQHDVEGQLEIPDNALISESEDNGAYILAWVWSQGPDQDEDEDGEDGEFTFAGDFGLHVNDDEHGKTSARDLEVGDDFNDGEDDGWYTVTKVWMVGDTVHVNVEDPTEDK
jgi:hypothetical protein